MISLRTRANRVTQEARHAGPPATTVADGARAAILRFLRVAYPFLVVARGTRRWAARIRGWYRVTPKEQRRLTLLAVTASIAGLCALPHGPVLLGLVVVIGAAWQGRGGASGRRAVPERGSVPERLQAVYNGLVPYLTDEHDPGQIFKPGGSYRGAFTDWRFDDQGRLLRLVLRYSPYFRDGEAESRARVEHALEGKIGRANEYLYDWAEEANRLTVRVLPPLPREIPATRWQVADIEYVLGFTDAAPGGRLMSVEITDGAGARVDVELAPLIWRRGPRHRADHLLVCGASGTGRTNTLRALAFQALHKGNLLGIIDTEHAGEYADLVHESSARVAQDGGHGPFVTRAAHLATDSGGAFELVEWLLAAAGEAQSRTGAAHAMAGLSHDGSRGVWLVVDDVVSLAETAGRDGRCDPQPLLAEVMRLAPSMGVTVLLGVRAEGMPALSRAVRAQARTRIGLGRIAPAVSVALFDGMLEVGGARAMPPGRGYARCGSGPVVRLQVPHAPGVPSHDVRRAQPADA